MVQSSDLVQCQRKDPRLDTFFGILQKHWAWQELSPYVHAEINADLNNDEELDENDCQIVEAPSSASNGGAAEEPEDVPSTPVLKESLRRMSSGIVGKTPPSNDMPPPRVPEKALLPPLPREVFPANPSELTDDERAQVRARIDAIRYLVSYLPLAIYVCPSSIFSFGWHHNMVTWYPWPPRQRLASSQQALAREDALEPERAAAEKEALELGPCNSAFLR